MPLGSVAAPVEIGYRLDRRVGGIHPGMHAGTESGGGLEPLRHETLLEGRDPRRLDLLASLRDPLRRLLVREYRQRASIRVCVLADLSASHGPGSGGSICHPERLVSVLGYSAGRAGDAFAFIGCDAHVRDELVLPPTRGTGAWIDLAARLAAFTPRGAGSEGLLEALPMIGGRRSLVFLVSDFHFSLELLDAVLAGLARHQVVPVVLADSGEHDPAPGFGLVRVADAETGEERHASDAPRVAASPAGRGRAAARIALPMLCGARRAPDRARGSLRRRSRQRLLQPVAWPASRRIGGRIELCLRRHGPGFPQARASRPPERLWAFDGSSMAGPPVPGGRDTRAWQPETMPPASRSAAPRIRARVRSC